MLDFIISISTVAVLVLFSTSANAAGLDFQCYGTEYVADREEFQTSKLSEVKKGVFPPGVFQHTGGGPNGSHWNFSGMRDGIFCVAEFPANDDDIRSIDIKAGPTIVLIQTKKEEIGDGLLLISFSMPFKTIERAARKIQRADLTLLYNDRKEEIALYLKNGAWNLIAPPTYGKVVEITLRIRTKTGPTHLLRRMIHATYGE